MERPQNGAPSHAFDRRIPAVLFLAGIDLYAKDIDDPIKEVYYTGAIWNIVAGSVAEHRSRFGVYRIKCVYSIGYGDGLTAEKEAPLQRWIAFDERFRLRPIVSMECAPAEVLSMLQTAPVDKQTWQGDHTPFLKTYTDMVPEWTPTVRPISNDVPVFGDSFERCLAAV